MSKVGFDRVQITSASFPIECPDCRRETVHTFDQTLPVLRLWRVSIALGRGRHDVKCCECGLVRPLSKADYTKIKPLIDRAAAAQDFSRTRHRHLQTGLGKVNADPLLMRRYTHKRILHAPVILLFLLLSGLCVAVMYNTYKVIAETRGDEMLENAFIAFEAEQYQEALTRAQKAQRLFHVADSPVKEAYSLLIIGHCEMESGDYIDALDAYKAGVPLWERINDQAMVAIGLRNMGIIYESIGEYRAALEAYRKAFEIFQEFGERWYANQLNEAIERVIDKLAGAANQEA